MLAWSHWVPPFPTSVFLFFLARYENVHGFLSAEVFWRQRQQCVATGDGWLDEHRNSGSWKKGGLRLAHGWIEDWRWVTAWLLASVFVFFYESPTLLSYLSVETIFSIFFH